MRIDISAFIDDSDLNITRIQDHGITDEVVTTSRINELTIGIQNSQT